MPGCVLPWAGSACSLLIRGDLRRTQAENHYPRPILQATSEAFVKERKPEISPRLRDGNLSSLVGGSARLWHAWRNGSACAFFSEHAQHHLPRKVSLLSRTLQAASFRNRRRPELELYHAPDVPSGSLRAACPWSACPDDGLLSSRHSSVS